MSNDPGLCCASLCPPVRCAPGFSRTLLDVCCVLPVGHVGVAFAATLPCFCPWACPGAVGIPAACVHGYDAFSVVRRRPLTTGGGAGRPAWLIRTHTYLSAI